MNKIDLAMKAAEALIKFLNILLPDVEREIASIRAKKSQSTVDLKSPD